MKAKLLSIAALLVMTGCSSTTTVPVSAPSDDSSKQVVPATSTQPASSRNIEPTTKSANNGSQSAVERLLDQAQQQQQQGRYSSASSSIERAIRIAPSNPVPYAQLAKLKQHMGDNNSARQLANKALSLQPPASTRREMRSLLDSI
ncbi:tetratricopeptide repeat protein [Sinobacterium norvegicum]|nr:tetratricopeptide repeat protein [Sinobacterium norvegicum]